MDKFIQAFKFTKYDKSTDHDELCVFKYGLDVIESLCLSSMNLGDEIKIEKIEIIESNDKSKRIYNEVPIN